MKNDYSYGEDEILFKKVNQLLRSFKCEYWVCHGTLLGIIRDNMILPWDHDIDFAVWKKKVKTEDIEKLFKDSGFKQEIILGEMDCLHFTNGSKKVDISFYDVKDNVASVRWVVPKKTNLKNKFLNFIAMIMHSLDNNIVIDLEIKNIKDLLKFLLIKVTKLIKPFIKKNTRKIIYENAIKSFCYTGYSYDINLMEFKNIVFLDEVVPVPIDSEKCLEMTYGKDWRVPKKNYVWYNEANNLINM